MVLAELGTKLSAALASVTRATMIDDKVIEEMVNAIGKALLDADVNVRLVKNLQVSIKKKLALEDLAAGINKRKLIHSTVIKELFALLDPGTKPYQPKKGTCSVVMFVGLQGSGKTTSCTKYAHWYKKKGFKVAMVCADTFRAGAFDQLKQNAIKAGIPYYGSYTEADPAVLAADGVEKFREEKFDMIIVDTSGRHKQQAELFEEMQQVAKATSPDEIVFVMDSSIGQAAKDQAQAFRDSVPVGSVIITKLDGHARGGGALSAVAATQSPIVFVGTGEHIDDFELFNTKSFVSRLLGMGDLDGLLSILGDEKLMDKQKELDLMNKLKNGGDFTFRDMYEQFQMLMSIGSLGKVMSMIPGFSNMMTKNTEEESVKRIKRFMTIMDSMTQKELDSDNKIFNTQPSRITRIANGAGVSIRAVQEVLETFKPFQKVIQGMKASGLADMDPSKMPKGGRGRGGRGGGMPDMRTMQKMLGSMGGKMRGGMGAQFQNMMRQMAGGMGGMDMQSLMSQMGGMMPGGGMPGMGGGRK